MNSKKDSLNWLGIAFSTVVHLLILTPTAYITYLAAQRNYSLFIWHPTCFTFGCGLLMTEATLAVSGEAILVAKVSRATRIKIHWVLHVLGLALVGVGMGTVVANKMKSGASHFVSDHAIIGLSSIVISVVVALGGVVILYGQSLSNVVNLSILKSCHGCLGIIATILFIAGQITGIYTRWWSGTELARQLSVAAYCISTFLLLVKPLYTTSLRIYDIFN